MSQKSVVQALNDASIKEGDLDELVHEVFSEKASRINNSGHADQVFFLRGEIGDDAILERLGIET